MNLFEGIGPRGFKAASILGDANPGSSKEEIRDSIIKGLKRAWKVDEPRDLRGIMPLNTVIVYSKNLTSVSMTAVDIMVNTFYLQVELWVFDSVKEEWFPQGKFFPEEKRV